MSAYYRQFSRIVRLFSKGPYLSAAYSKNSNVSITGTFVNRLAGSNEITVYPDITCRCWVRSTVREWSYFSVDVLGYMLLLGRRIGNEEFFLNLIIYWRCIHRIFLGTPLRRTLHNSTKMERSLTNRPSFWSYQLTKICNRDVFSSQEFLPCLELHH